MGGQKLTDGLLSDSLIADLFQRATECEFLRLGGLGRLPRQTLNEWLSQDRLYALAYIRFIGGLISRVKLPIEIDQQSTSSTLQWRILCILEKSLAGIVREIKLFEEMALLYDLDLNAIGTGENKFGPCATTQGYIDLFDSFTARPETGSPRTLFAGLVVLWGTEKAYLGSWSYANRQSLQTTGFEKDLDGGVLRKHLMPQWTSSEFHLLVEELRACLDAYEESLTGEENEDARFAAAADMIKKVFILEEGFWPVAAEGVESFSSKTSI